MKTMNKKTIITILLALVAMLGQAQLFHPLGLGFNGGERQGECSHPRMHIKGDKLYICTSLGLYAKDLTNDNSAWKIVGFEGIPLLRPSWQRHPCLALQQRRRFPAPVS